MKKTLLFLSMVALGLPALTGCNEKADFTVGILQVATHPALDGAREGFISAMKKDPLLEGKKIKFIQNNSQGVSADEASMAKSLVTKCDMLLGISTGSSVALKSAILEAGKQTPLLFTAVTDPVDAALVSSLTNHGGFVTGTSDDNPVEAQVDLISRCLEGKSTIKLGILYTGSEINSEVQADRAEQEAKAKGMEVTRATCTDSSDIKAVASNLAKKVDVIYIPTDNNIAAHMDSVKAVTDENHVLCIVGEENMLTGGGHLTYSVSYDLLGKRTGEMGALILSGTKTAGEIDVEKMLDEQYLSKVFNSRNIQDSGIVIPTELLKDFKDVA